MAIDWGFTDQGPTTDPHTGQAVQWETARMPTFNPTGIDSQSIALLKAAGLWNDSYGQGIDWGTDPAGRAAARQQWEASPEYQQLQQSLGGYTQGQTRDGYTLTDYLRDPQGNVVGQNAYSNQGPSLHSNDYQSMAAVLAMAAGGLAASGELGALGGAGSGTAATTAAEAGSSLGAYGSLGADSAAGLVGGGGGAGGSLVAPGAFSSGGGLATAGGTAGFDAGVLGATGGGGATAGSWIPGISNQSVVQGGVGLANTLIQSNANQNAIEAQRDAAAQQNALQKAQYDQTRADNAPWRAAGESALAKLSGLLQDGSLSSRFAGKLDNEAGYQFAKQEGMRAVDNSASARGGIGGAALKAGTRFAENNANQFYNDAFNRWNTENTGTYNRLSNMAGLGQVANSQVGAAGQNYVNQSGNALIGLGNANAAAGINQGNIYGNLLNQGAALGNQYNWWQDARSPDINNKNPGG